MGWIINGTAELDQISEWQTILGVCIVLPILTATIVILRAYTRGHVLRGLGWDDYVIFFSAVLAIIYAGLCIAQSRYGLGLPLKMRPKPDLDRYSVINFAGRPLYMFGILGFKVALCLAYLRILSTTNKAAYKALVYLVMATCTVGHVTGTLVLIFQCSPVRKSWRPLVPGHCLPNDNTFYGLAAVTIFFDVIIFFLPIPLLLSLNIEPRKKAVLCCVFLLGLLTTVCSIMRMVQIMTIAKTGNSTMLVLWGVIELNIGIILTCIPTLGPLFPCFHTAINTSHSKHSYQSYPLSGLDSNIQSRANTVHATAPFDKYEAFPPDFAGAEVHASDSSSQDDTVRLKDHPRPRRESMGYAASIVKTTDIRVSEDAQLERDRARAFARPW